jgi:monoamine oxidase
MWDLIVVGGGYCGVTVAVEAERRLPGARVLLLEASDRLGGRARSFAAPTRAGRPAQALDLGAHYFGRRQVRVHALARRLLAPEQIYSHLRTYGEDPAFRCLLEGAWRSTTLQNSFLQMQGLDKDAPLYDRVSIFKSLALYLAFESLIDGRAPWKTPLARWLDRTTVRQWIERQRVPGWIKEMWGLACLDILSIHPEQVSLLYWLWYHATNNGFLDVANDFAGGPEEFSVEIGLGGLLEKYAAEIRGTVLLESPVSAVDHRAPDRVEVTTVDGRIFRARRVVMAASPRAVGRHVRFSPALHPARERLHRQPIGHAAKAVLFYAEPWWHDRRGHRYYGMSAGPGASELEWALDTSHPDGRQYSLTAFVSHTLFDRLGARASEAELHHAIASGMAEMTGNPAALDYQHVEVFRWRALPYIGGGPNTSLAPGTLSALGEIFNRPEGPYGRLYFASAEYATWFSGYVEGAIAAGEAVADQIVRGALRQDQGVTGDPAPCASASATPAPVGRGPCYVRALGFLAAWALLVPICEVIRLVSRSGVRHNAAGNGHAARPAIHHSTGDSIDAREAEPAPVSTGAGS